MCDITTHIFEVSNSMTILGLPTEMFLVFVLTFFAGTIGAAHYLVVHVLMNKPVDESGLQNTIAGRNKDGS